MLGIAYRLLKTYLTNGFFLLLLANPELAWAARQCEPSSRAGARLTTIWVSDVDMCPPDYLDMGISRGFDESSAEGSRLSKTNDQQYYEDAKALQEKQTDQLRYSVGALFGVDLRTADEKKKAAEAEAVLQERAAVGSNLTPVNVIDRGKGIAEGLEKLSKLYSDGMLTDEEFKLAKRNLLGL